MDVGLDEPRCHEPAVDILGRRIGRYLPNLDDSRRRCQYRTSLGHVRGCGIAQDKIERHDLSRFGY